MTSNTINFATILLAAVFGFRETILLSTGKKIVKSSSQLLLYFLVAIYLASIFVKNLLLMTLIMITVILLYAIIKYFIGIKYKVQTDELKNLQRLIGEAIDKVLGASYEMIKEDKLITFNIEGNKAIEIKISEGLFRSKTDYHINFTRWSYYESKRDILEYISAGLMNEEYERSRIKSALKLVTFIPFILVLLVFNANIIMEQEFTIREVITEDFPNEIYLTSIDEYYGDNEMMDKLQKILNKGYGFKIKEIPEALYRYQGIIEFPETKRILYIDKKAIYLFVHDSEIGNRSVLNFIAWQLHKLYDKKEGVFYKINLLYEEEQKFQELLLDITGAAN